MADIEAHITGTVFKIHKKVGEPAGVGTHFLGRGEGLRG